MSITGSLISTPSIGGEISSSGTVQGTVTGLKTINGYSAFEIAVINGFKGTEAEWLESLVGEQGPVGPVGPRGEQGVQGIQGVQGVGVASVVQTITSEKDDGINIITVTKTDDTTSTFAVKNGSKGSQGVAGIGIKSVVQTQTSSEDAGANIVTVTKTDGTTSEFAVKNGSKGSQGISIESVIQTTTSTEDDGANIVTVTKTDGTTSEFAVKNGSKGSTGDSGVYIGESQPTDPNINVWINPNGEVEALLPVWTTISDDIVSSARAGNEVKTLISDIEKIKNAKEIRCRIELSCPNGLTAGQGSVKVSIADERQAQYANTIYFSDVPNCVAGGRVYGSCAVAVSKAGRWNPVVTKYTSLQMPLTQQLIAENTKTNAEIMYGSYHTNSMEKYPPYLIVTGDNVLISENSRIILEVC